MHTLGSCSNRDKKCLQQKERPHVQWRWRLRLRPPAPRSAEGSLARATRHVPGAPRPRLIIWSYSTLEREPARLTPKPGAETEKQTQRPWPLKWGTQKSSPRTLTQTRSARPRAPNPSHCVLHHLLTTLTKHCWDQSALLFSTEKQLKGPSGDCPVYLPYWSLKLLIYIWLAEQSNKMKFQAWTSCTWISNFSCLVNSRNEISAWKKRPQAPCKNQ